MGFVVMLASVVFYRSWCAFSWVWVWCSLFDCVLDRMLGDSWSVSIYFSRPSLCSCLACRSWHIFMGSIPGFICSIKLVFRALGILVCYASFFWRPWVSHLNLCRHICVGGSRTLIQVSFQTLYAGQRDAGPEQFPLLSEGPWDIRPAGVAGASRWATHAPECGPAADVSQVLVLAGAATTAPGGLGTYSLLLWLVGPTCVHLRVRSGCPS